MKYYQLIGVRGDNKIIERFFDDGRRFLKYIPFNPKIVITLKEQFKNRPIDVDFKEGWIIITKTGFDEQMAQASDSVLKGETLTIERLAEEEKKMLERAGYKVEYMIGEYNG